MSEAKTIGVILSGSGYLDGAAIQEAVLCLLGLSRAGVEIKICAPNIDVPVTDHLSGQPSAGKRNVLVESARIARGKIVDIKSVQGSEVDGWVLPGGFGAANNLCDFATRGAKATANREIARVVRDALAAQVPIGAVCIAPALLAVITKSSGPHLTLTIGDDADTAAAVGALGAKHVECAVDDIVVDDVHKVVSTPAYMYGDAAVHEVAIGIGKLIDQVLAWA